MLPIKCTPQDGYAYLNYTHMSKFVILSSRLTHFSKVVIWFNFYYNILGTEMGARLVGTLIQRTLHLLPTFVRLSPPFHFLGIRLKHKL